MIYVNYSLSPFPSRNMLFPEYYDWTRNIDSGISPGNHPDNEGSSKIMDDRSSKEEEYQHHYHHCSIGEDGSSKGFIDTDIENRFEVFLPHLFDVLSDTIKNDNRIIDREPNDRQDDSHNI